MRGLLDSLEKKKCPHCNTVKEMNEFYGRGPGRTRASWCKNCTNGRNKLPQVKINKAKYRRSKKGKATAFRSHVGLRYKITIAEFESMLESQNNCCAICGKEFTNTKNSTVPYVDHNHDTGRVRELLCHHCNLGLGYFGDNPELVQLGYLYLLKHAEENT